MAIAALSMAKFISKHSNYAVGLASVIELLKFFHGILIGVSCLR
jgi:hypothetical protein